MTRSANTSLALALGASAVTGAVIAFQSSREWSAAADLGIAVVAFGIALVAFKFCLDWWKTADEAVREAHKFAWYWGGSVGLGVAGGMAVAFLRYPDFLLAKLAPTGGGAELFAAGVVACMVCQAVGYSAAWAGWWLKRR